MRIKRRQIQRTSRIRIAFAFMALAVTTLSPQADADSPENVVASWAAQSSHPLTGKVLDPRTGRLVDGAAPTGESRRKAVITALGIATARFILLGEVHGNAEHHRLRAALIDDLTGLTRFGRTIHPPVVVEHIRADQAAALEDFRAFAADLHPPPLALDLFRMIEWERSGWPSASIFRPLYDTILGARLRLVAGEPARERIRLVAREGLGRLATLDAAEHRRLRLDQRLEPPLAAALDAELAGSHCGMLPAQAIPRMAEAQRYRDAHLADAMIREAPILEPVILLAGNGHVRSDRGVPWHLRLRAPGMAIAAILLVEVDDQRTDPASYVPRAPDGRAAADAIVFTPRAKREDPCERMRAHMQKKG